MNVRPFTKKKEKPIILLILGGEFHLDLYASLLETNQEFNWAVFIKDIAKIPNKRLSDLNSKFGTYFFTDRATALAHFGDIDAVITTFAVPHAAHLYYLEFAALACEMGIPVFEIQHGLFQIGISYSEESFLVGSGDKKHLARNALPVRNLAPNTLRWFGENAIGYPPYTDAVRADSSYLHDEMEEEGPPEKILYLTNFHWNLLDAQQRDHGYSMITKSILALPDGNHVISPHPAEVQSPLFRNMVKTLEDENATNFEIVRPESAEHRITMLRQTKVAVSSISTVLLDLEMMGIPTLLFDLPGFRSLQQGLEEFTAVSDGSTLVRQLKHVLYSEYFPELHTGKLKPFNRQALVDSLHGEIHAGSMTMAEKIVTINKYLKGL